ncbi:nicotinate-nucleotide adenylyltransferase [Solibacillus sp. FSL H8-0538]|uniref:nicotinate-nucleotide adenylyltransferase n=1 Tax=Solibacillus sp. FSL H8-0538 TaxID=2921400 RepID=UPI0030FA0FFB
MKKVGILGGTFNPPHIGHLIMANEVYYALGLDEVRFMPNAKAPHKEAGHAVTNAQRMRMVELMTELYPQFKVEHFEMDRGGISYTYDTIVEMLKREPDVQFYFIIGGDMIDSLHTWYCIEELSKLVQFVGVKRPGTQGETSYNVIMVEAPEINLSSSFIRNRLQAGRTLQFLLHPAVDAYIRKEGLYGTSDITRSD